MTDQELLVSELGQKPDPRPGSVHANVTCCLGFQSGARETTILFCPWASCHPVLWVVPSSLSVTLRDQLSMPLLKFFLEDLLFTHCGLSGATGVETLPAIHTGTLVTKFMFLPPPRAPSQFFSLCVLPSNNVLHPQKRQFPNPYLGTDPTAARS